MERLVSLFGVCAMVGVAWLLSVGRKDVKWRPVLWGMALQLIMGAIIFFPGVGDVLFDAIDVGVKRLLSFAEEGTEFVFKTIEAHEATKVDPVTGEVTTAIIGDTVSPGVRGIAFWILPTVIFFSALMALLYHYGVMQWIVRGFAWAMRKTMGVSGAESLSAAGNIFVGQTEAPLLVKPFVSTMTMSELNAIMVGGFATIAGGVLALYVGALHSIPGIAGHLVTASLMSAPAALAIAKVLVPETGTPVTMNNVEMPREELDVNGIDAVARGTLDGLKLFLNILAMLIAFVAMVALANAIIAGIGSIFGLDISLQAILGYCFAPFAFVLGIPWDEALTAGMLLGEKLVLTELFAFFHLSEIQASPDALSDRSAVIISYALCGFANFASIGIQIGGIGGIAPERRSDLARLGLRAMIGGTLAAMMTGGVAGVMYNGP